MPHVLASGALELELLILLSRSHDCICSSSPIKMMIGFVFDVQPCKNMELFRVLFALSAQKHAKQRPAPKWSTMATIFDDASLHFNIDLLSTSAHVLASGVTPTCTVEHKICDSSSC
jgi:hypothetical protein